MSRTRSILWRGRVVLHIHVKAISITKTSKRAALLAEEECLLGLSPRLSNDASLLTALVQALLPRDCLRGYQPRTLLVYVDWSLASSIPFNHCKGQLHEKS